MEHNALFKTLRPVKHLVELCRLAGRLWHFDFKSNIARCLFLLQITRQSLYRSTNYKKNNRFFLPFFKLVLPIAVLLIIKNKLGISI